MKHHDPIHVYIAGPIDGSGNFCENVRQAFDAAKELLHVPGVYPYVPHLDFSLVLTDPDFFSRELLLEWDFAWVRRCDALLRLHGVSDGADQEVEIADKAGIPVFYELDDLLDWISERKVPA